MTINAMARRCAALAVLIPIIFASDTVRACAATGGLGRSAAAHLTTLPSAPGAVRVHSEFVSVPALDDVTCTPFDRLAILLASEVAKGTPIILGEIHDNPHHHALRALLLDYMASKARFGVVMEHLGPEQGDALAALARERTTDRGAVDRFFMSDAWQKSGWPAPIFAPIFDTLRNRDLPLAGGNIARDRALAIARGGLGATTAEERDSYYLGNAFWLDLLDDDLMAELEASHCGLLPRKAFVGMALAQRARDGAMAQAVAASRRRHGGAVLLTGNGHARRDRGVPLVLRNHTEALFAFSVGFIEVPDGADEVAIGRAIPKGILATPAFRMTVFARTISRPDPCAEMRKAFEARKK